jgi:hypothetical protein
MFTKARYSSSLFFLWSQFNQVSRGAYTDKADPVVFPAMHVSWLSLLLYTLWIHQRQPSTARVSTVWWINSCDKCISYSCPILLSFPPSSPTFFFVCHHLLNNINCIVLGTNLDICWSSSSNQILVGYKQWVHIGTTANDVRSLHAWIQQHLHWHQDLVSKWMNEWIKSKEFRYNQTVQGQTEASTTRYRTKFPYRSSIRVYNYQVQHLSDDELL